jgi:lysophospholipase L1-like esterase
VEVQREKIIHKLPFRGGKQSLKIILPLILLTILATMLFLSYRQQQEDTNRLRQVASEQLEARWEEEARLKELEENSSFYQKLSAGLDVNILIVGDSIGASSGARKDGRWFDLLQLDLESTYSSKVSLRNISMGGNSSYAGYVRTMKEDDEAEYDLAIICYGQNDSPTDFPVYYESIIYALRSKYPHCSIISILESSQREYTEKMKTIQDICEYYKIPVADTIKAFQDSGQVYSELCDDGIHPNDEGYQFYFKAVKDVIDSNVMNATGWMEISTPIDSTIPKFSNFQYYSKSSGSNPVITRSDDVTYVLNATTSGLLGIDYSLVSGANQLDIFIDGRKIFSETTTFDYDFTQRRFRPISENETENSEIRLVFGSKKQADEFYGVCLSW